MSGCPTTVMMLRVKEIKQPSWCHIANKQEIRIPILGPTPLMAVLYYLLDLAPTSKNF